MKKQPELKGQLSLSGGAMDVIYQQAKQINYYESERQRLKRVCKSYGEYVDEINQLKRRLRI